MAMLTRYDDFSRVFFEDFFGFGSTPSASSRPSFKEEEDKFVFSLAAPGLDKSDFSINLEGNKLTLGYDASQKSEPYITSSRFKKSYTLPNNIDSQNINATYKNGVLFVTVPKSEVSKVLEIQVK